VRHPATGTAHRDLNKLGENHFILEIPGLAIGAFSELGGLSVERELFEYAEGGVNAFVHKLPGRLKYPNLTFKRGITDQDALQRWFWESQTTAQLREVTIKLVDPTGALQRMWTFTGAFPVKWTGPKLAAGSDSAATEELEVAHQGLLRI
jgi:phage tail-like protein